MTNYTAKDANRFWKKVIVSDDPDACWIWTASTNKAGYGHLFWNKKICTASRISYEMAFGVFDDQLKVLHTCDNPPCVNPRHLWLGTHLDNAQDRAQKDRNNSRHGEQHGRCKLTDAQVKIIRDTYENGHTTQRELAKRFNVSQSLIDHLIKRMIRI